MKPRPVSPQKPDPQVDAVVQSVVADLWQRSERGITKYGAPVGVQPLDLKTWMQHAYEEALDFAIYLKRAMRDMP